MDNKVFNFLGFPLNLGALGINLNEMYGFIKLHMFTNIDINRTLTLVISICAIIWWLFKIWGQYLENKKSIRKLHEKDPPPDK